VVTRQLQVERRTGKVRRSKTDVLSTCHATKYNEVDVIDRAMDYLFGSVSLMQLITSFFLARKTYWSSVDVPAHDVNVKVKRANKLIIISS